MFFVNTCAYLPFCAILTFAELKICLLLQLDESWDEPVLKSSCFFTCVWAFLADKNTPCMTKS